MSARAPGGATRILALVDVTRRYEIAVRGLALGRLRRSQVLVLTRRGSPIAREFRRVRGERAEEDEGGIALAYLVSGTPHPRAVGEWEFELSPSLPQILGVVSAAVESWPRGVTVLLDSLTDLCTLNGVDDTIELARNLVKVLREVDSLILLMVGRVHPPRVVRSFARELGAERVLELP
ncbi:MAG: hypothetical protein QI223_10090 [Candidatus Korarchaeota archaeon]|nr:hypothetical protein [Candidatus Korarchaeota archaeon]